MKLDKFDIEVVAFSVTRCDFEHTKLNKDLVFLPVLYTCQSQEVCMKLYLTSNFYWCQPLCETGCTPAQQQEGRRLNSPERLGFTNKKHQGRASIMWGIVEKVQHPIYQRWISLPIGTLNNYCNMRRKNQFLPLLKLNLNVKLGLSSAALLLFSAPERAASSFFL